MKRINEILLFLVLLSSSLFYAYKFFYFLEQVTFTNHYSRSKNPNALIVCSSIGFGGKEVYVLNLYKQLLKNNYNVHILIPKKSGLEKKCIENKLNYYRYNKFEIRLKTFKTSFEPGLSHAIKKICSEQNINLIHCNVRREIRAARQSSDTIKIVYTHHTPTNVPLDIISKTNGIIGINPTMIEYFEKEFESLPNTNIPLKLITPFFNQEKFENFTSHQSAATFFANNFGIKIKQAPIVSCVANLHLDKNQQLLLKACASLIHEKQIPLQLVLAGDGMQRKKLEKLASELAIIDYVHFLGFTDKTPEILHFSDLFVLPSSKEGFGIVLMEAAIMKKPIIIANGTGGSHEFIQHDKTGLLFEPDNIHDLAQKIEETILNPNKAQILGNNVYQHWQHKFTNQACLEKLMNLYLGVLH